MLRWLRAHGCPWDARTCAEAAYSGLLDVLQWAREQDCPWNWLTLYHAEQRGHLDVLQWAREHGCPAEMEVEWMDDDLLESESEDEAGEDSEADGETED